MNLDERIEAAWKELSGYANVSTGRDRLVFTLGYRESMRSLYVEVKPEEMAVGREYTALIRQDYGLVQWFDGVMVSLSDESRVCVWGPSVNMSFHCWIYWLKSDVVLAVAANPIPSPAEIFGN